jgi:hypothetical protein
MKDTSLSDRAMNRPTGACRFTSDDRMYVEKMNCDGLNGLRRFVTVMLHPIGICEQRVE